MPTVPGSAVPEGLGQNVGSGGAGDPLTQPSPTNLLMAAATMKDLGRYDPNSPLTGATSKVPHGRRRR